VAGETQQVMRGRRGLLDDGINVPSWQFSRVEVSRIGKNRFGIWACRELDPFLDNRSVKVRQGDTNDLTGQHDCLQMENQPNALEAFFATYLLYFINKDGQSWRDSYNLGPADNFMGDSKLASLPSTRFFRITS
jgi:hypothetical protein